MKIRNGFVSNSSSSSFLIYGICMSANDLESFEKMAEKMEEDGEYVDIEEILNNELTAYSPYDDNYYIGLSPDKCRDDQTMGDFKKSIEDTLVKHFGERIRQWKMDFFSEAWYDG